MAWPGGYVELPMLLMMSVGLRPRISAAMIARTVRMPVPRSWVAVLSSTEPSGLMVQETCLPGSPPPPQVCRAMPMPVRIGPVPVLPRGLRFSPQPISSAPMAISAW